MPYDDVVDGVDEKRCVASEDLDIISFLWYRTHVKMPAPNSFIVRKTSIGDAVFAARPFKHGERVAKFTGSRIHESKVPKRYRGKKDRYMQMEMDYYLGPSGKIDDIFNHSCDPNAGLKFTSSGIFLVAIRNINTGDEITWDYSSTLLKSPWKMRCARHEKNCRKIIGDFLSLDSRTQAKYLRLGIVPQHIKDFMLKSHVPVYTSRVGSLKHVHVA